MLKSWHLYRAQTIRQSIFARDAPCNWMFSMLIKAFSCNDNECQTNTLQSGSTPVFTLDIADNYPLHKHIIIENRTGKDTEMGSSTAFSYPQLDQLHLKLLNQYTFKKYIKIILHSLWLLLQDWTLLDFLLGDGNWIKEIGKKNSTFLVYL